MFNWILSPVSMIVYCNIPVHGYAPTNIVKFVTNPHAQTNAIYIFDLAVTGILIYDFCDRLRKSKSYKKFLMIRQLLDYYALKIITSP